MNWYHNSPSFYRKIIISICWFVCFHQRFVRRFGCSNIEAEFIIWNMDQRPRKSFTLEMQHSLHVSYCRRRRLKQVIHAVLSYTFRVENVKEVKLGDITFKSHKDHSKWAVSTRMQQPWICIADINRMVCHYSKSY